MYKLSKQTKQTNETKQNKIRTKVIKMKCFFIQITSWRIKMIGSQAYPSVAICLFYLHLLN